MVATREDKIFTTLSYPNPYYPDERCDWSIRSPFDNRGVEITFTDFELEDDSECLYDKVELYRDGEFDRLGCGDKFLNVSFQAAKEIRVFFRTDGGKFDNQRGFRVVYRLGKVLNTYTVMPQISARPII